MPPPSAPLPIPWRRQGDAPKAPGLRARRRPAPAAVTVALLVLAGAPRAQGPALDLGKAERRAALPAGTLGEASGLVRSRRDPALFWTHNDSGGRPTVYAIDEHGALVGRAEIEGARAEDWEDLAIDDRGRLVVADCGDNRRIRREATLYRFPEPDPRVETRLRAEAFRFRFPTGIGATDVEGIAARGDAALLFSKERGRTRVFALDLDAPGGPPRTLRRVATLEGIGWVSGADLASDGTRLALVTTTATVVFSFDAALAPGDEAPDAQALFDRSSRTTRALAIGQVEGVALSGDAVWFVTEAAPGRLSAALPGQLFRAPLTERGKGAGSGG